MFAIVLIQSAYKIQNTKCTYVFASALEKKACKITIGRKKIPFKSDPGRYISGIFFFFGSRFLSLQLQFSVLCRRQIRHSRIPDSVSKAVTLRGQF